MQIAAIQHDIVWEDPDANFAQLAGRIKEAANEGARLIALSEMFAWGFSMETDRVNEPVGGPSTTFLSEQAVATGAWVCGSVPELPEGGEHPYNQLVVAAPDGSISRYAKIYPFSYGGEHLHYTAGTQTLTETITVDGESLRVSFFVCYDLRFADEFWKLAPDTDVYVVVANWPEARRHHWRSLLMARAIENQAYVVAANRVGEGGRLTYSGDSSIIDPFGELLAWSEYDETTLMADVTAERVTEVRTRYPFLSDRR